MTDRREESENQSAQESEVTSNKDPEALDGEYIREEREGPADTSDAISSDTRPRVRIGMLVLLITFVGFGGWAAFAPLNGAAVAPGEVIVDSRNRVVQHLEGGVVSEIRVEDGDSVDQGETLLKLSDTQARSELNTVESQLWEVLGREARLLAERADADKIAFPETLTKRKDDPEIASIIEGQREVFEARRESLKGQIDIYEQQIQAQRVQMEGLQALVGNLDSRVGSYSEELEGWRDLFERELSDRLRINKMEREMMRLKGEKISTEAEVGKLDVKIGETRSQILVTRQDFIEKVATKLRETQERKADLQSRRVALQDKLNRLDITAPTAGRVVGLKVHTEGGVIKPGDTIMEIVPAEQVYAVQARVKPTDIDRIKENQLADIRLSAFNYQVAHVLEGKVVNISADALEEKQRNNNERYYEARIRLTDKGLNQLKAQDMYFVPGMPAEVMIKTGERTFLEYLLEPFTRLVQRAFREE